MSIVSTQRRQLVLGLGAFPLLAGRQARAADKPFPAQAIRVTCPYAAGSPVDIVGRFMAACMQRGLGGSPVVMENVAGGGGTVGPAHVLRQPADGYQLLTALSGSLATGQLLNPSTVKYDGARDFAPLWGISTLGTVIVVSAKSPYKTMQQFMDAARAHPGRISYGSAGVGSAPHVYTEMFMRATGIKMLHVPYKSSAEVINDILGGQVDCELASIASAAQLIADGRLRGLAVLKPQRVAAIPGVPTLKESGVSGWLPTPSIFTIFAPAKVPRAIREQIAAACQQGFDQDPTAKDALARLGLDATFTGSELTRFVDAERDELRRAIKEAGIQGN